MQIQTDRNGTIWARWIDESPAPVQQQSSRAKASPGVMCAHCGDRDRTWRTVPDSNPLPRAELSFECKVCVKTTRQGRYTHGASEDDRAGFGGSRNARR
jgi:hypothetical protein